MFLFCPFINRKCGFCALDNKDELRCGLVKPTKGQIENHIAKMTKCPKDKK